MSFWTSDNIRSACGGVWLARPGDAGGGRVDGFTIDSRAVKPGNVFLALRGETFDGHDFLLQAAQAGAALLIVERGDAAPAGLPEGAAMVRVPDSRKALLRLAGAYRKSLETTKVIAVCGSNGKTTTTRLIHAMLSSRLRGSCSAKSFNNEIGVPVTILSAKESDQYLICEVGSNAPGEIAQLAGVVKPDIAVITSIGREHLERLGTLEGVAREEAAILKELRPGGAAIITGDTPLLSEHVRGLAAEGRTVVSFGRAQTADLRLSSFEHFASEAGPGGAPPTPDSIRFGVNSRWQFSAPMVGEHNAVNALAALAVARRFGLSDADVNAGLTRVVVPDMRLQRMTLGGVQIVNDAYNANPDSTLAALRTFAALYAPADRRVVVLGDNLELGAAGPEAHREIGRTILELGCIDRLVTVGPLAALAGEVLAEDWSPPERITRLPDLEGGRDRQVARMLRPGDALLLKGSRRMALERIVAALRPSGPPASPAASGPAPEISSARSQSPAGA